MPHQHGEQFNVRNVIEFLAGPICKYNIPGQLILKMGMINKEDEDYDWA